MEDILRSVVAVPGVSDCIVLDEEGNIVDCVLTQRSRDYTLSVVGYTTAHILAGLRMARRKKVGTVDLQFRDGRVVVRPLRQGHLCMVCQGRVSLPLLNLTVDVALPKLNAAMEQRNARQRLAPPPTETEETGSDENLAASSSHDIGRFLRPFGT